jgi:hypothetical protein
MELKSPRAYYISLASEYAPRRERLLGIFTTAGFRCFNARGAYYIITDNSASGEGQRFEITSTRTRMSIRSRCNHPRPFMVSFPPWASRSTHQLYEPPVHAIVWPEFPRDCLDRA